ncbi:MAG: YfhO family protein [Candidatus Sumerlaeaceae bacterium]|nr:YfhO family protein [Candidatus Sumerlaeaceae bacterium]
MNSSKRQFATMPGIEKVAPYAIAIAFSILPFLTLLPRLASSYLGFSHNDIQNAYRHFITFACRELFSGHLPVWNPYIFCGTPFLANTDSTLYYPPNLLLWFALPQPLSLNLSMMFHLALFATGMVFLSRSRGLSTLASAFAGSVAGLSAVIIPRIFAGHFTMVCSLAWVPLVLARQGLLLKQPSFHNAAMLGLCAGAMVLGGHYQIAYYAALFCFLTLAVALAPSLLGNRRIAVIHLGYQLLAMVLAAGLAAIELVPVADAMQFSARTAQKGAEWFSEFSLLPQSYLAALAPWFHISANGEKAPWYWWEQTVYFGMLPLSLALGRISGLVRKRQFNFPAVALILAVIMASIGLVPHSDLLLRWIPGWAIFRGHGRIILFGLIYAIILAAEQFDAIHREGPRRAWESTIVAVLLCSLVWFIGTSIPGGKPDPTRNLPAFPYPESANTAWIIARIVATGTLAALALASLWKRPASVYMLTAVAVADLLCYAWPAIQRTTPADNSYASKSFWEFAREFREEGRILSTTDYLSSEPISHEVSVVGGNDISLTRFINTTFAAMSGISMDEPHFDYSPSREHPLLDAANLRFVMLKNDSPAITTGVLEVAAWSDVSSIFRRLTALPRTYVVSHAQFIGESEMAVYDSLTTPTVDFHLTALICHTPWAGKSDGRKSKPVIARVKYDSTTTARILVPKGAAGWLVLADAYYPRWTATINGERAQVYRANGGFRAVRVKGGEEVVFQYQLYWHLIGIAVTLATILVFMAHALGLTKRISPGLRQRFLAWSTEK